MHRQTGVKTVVITHPNQPELPEEVDYKEVMPL